MNKKELIDYCNAIKENKSQIINCIDVNGIIKKIEQLDEPEKVKVPQFIADWIEHFKKTSDWDLFQAMDYLFEHTITCEWIETKDNQELFARAWIFGYEVEKEPKYIVKMKRMHKDCTVLKKNKDGGYWYLSDTYPYSSTVNFHTRKELEDAGFGEVFNSPLFEVEEVE